MRAKTKIILSLAVLREISNKIKYYELVIENNIKRLNVVANAGILKDKAEVDKELKNLIELKKKVELIDIFVEYMITRLETIIAVENLTLATSIIKELAKELKRSIGGVLPALDIYIDELNRLSNDTVRTLSLELNISENNINVREEARKIIDEAKAVIKAKNI
ncbi:MAG: hypothetical protein JHC33_06625 [Ignisphaera sp.]|nr:hypothetical protein [Ignisphaera sp.]